MQNFAKVSVLTRNCMSIKKKVSRQNISVWNVSLWNLSLRNLSI